MHKAAGSGTRSDFELRISNVELRNGEGPDRGMLAAGRKGEMPGMEHRNEELEVMHPMQPEHLKAWPRQAYLRRSLANSFRLMSTSWRI